VCSSDLVRDITDSIVPLIDAILFNSTICSKLFNMEIIRKNRIVFDELLTINEDYLFHFQYMSHISRIITVSGCKYIYSYHPSTPSLSTNRTYSYEVNINRSIELSFAHYDLYKSWGYCGYFSQTESNLQRIILHTIISCYSQHATKYYKNTAWNLFIVDEFKEKYQPSSLKGRMIKQFFMHIPKSLLKIILYILSI
jgi:hypothetical protein